MKRRQFLQAAGTAGLALARQPREAPAAETGQTGQAAQGHRAKAVLITSAETPLALALAEGLATQYRVRWTSRSAARAPSRFEYVPSPLEHDASTRSVVRGMDAVVLAPEAPAQTGAAPTVDERARWTYNLLQAAALEGVRAAVFLSSMEMMAGYDPRFAVDEQWRPLPTLRSGALPDYLGEFTCREFAREGKLAVAVLRLGRVRQTQEKAGQPGDGLALDGRDAVQAVDLALRALLAEPARLGPWSVFHIVSAAAESRFPSAKAQRVLGYRPHCNR